MTRLIAASLALPAALAVQANLITNGDFESGYSGFFTEYEHADGAGEMMWIGFDIVENPRDVHGMAASYHDRTLAGSKMLMINGDPGTRDIVWQQTIPVLPHSQYDFSLWYSAWYSRRSLNQVEFNGAHAFGFDANDSFGKWTRADATWLSGDATKLTISIINVDTKLVGNDVALDDISLNFERMLASQVPDGGSTLAMFLGAFISMAAWKRSQRRS